MKRDIVAGKEIESVGYGRYSSKLEIEFSNGDIFQYSKVPLDTYESFISEDCCSGFFDKYIRPNYSFRKLS